MKRFLLVVLILFLALTCLVGIFQSCTADVTYAPDQDGANEFDQYDSLQTVHYHKRSWQDYYNEKNYSMQYGVEQSASALARQARESWRVTYWNNDNDFWQQVYYAIYEQNKTRLGFVQDSLAHLRDSLQLGRDDFARMVVSFVQDIPYNYILPDSCDAHHSDFPCVPSVKYGILSPVEFLNTLQGDCDTRTVLLFTLLRNFGYEPVIVNSNQYLHSMLALDIPAPGDYLEHKGKRYAFWETTNVGWLPGMIPPDMNNTSYWQVILDL
jgi:hypothetical protein